jgi:hypothetical protein
VLTRLLGVHEDRRNPEGDEEDEQSRTPKHNLANEQIRTPVVCESGAGKHDLTVF